MTTAELVGVAFGVVLCILLLWPGNVITGDQARRIRRGAEDYD